MAKSRTDLTGAAGEYYVAAELARMGYVASLTMANTQGIDILATDPKSGKLVAIQVKATRGVNRAWILRSKKDSNTRQKAIYIFVNIPENKPPEYFIVPERLVTQSVNRSHREWISGRRRDGRKRKNSSMRKFQDKAGRYKDKWNLLWR